MTYQEMFQESVENPESFWGRAAEAIVWDVETTGTDQMACDLVGIALAVNGVPIFNALNNRGEDSHAIGELDKWGGHCGRGDDYHYHVAPVFLNGGDASRVVAYALDGYAIYGFAEPDGSMPGKLDEFNGHTTPALGYHYHVTPGRFPYIIGGYRGVPEPSNNRGLRRAARIGKPAAGARPPHRPCETAPSAQPASRYGVRPAGEASSGLP